MLTWYITSIDLQILNPLHLWDKSHLIMTYDPFNVLLNSVCYILLRIFASVFISDIDLQFSFFVASLSGFGNRVMLASQNKFESLPSSAIFCKSLSRIPVISLNFWQNSSVKLSGPRLLCCWQFFDYQLNIVTTNQSVQIFYLFMVQS